MIFPIKHAMETYSEVIPFWSREDDNYVGLQKHTSKFVVLNLWISQCHRGRPKRVAQSPQHISCIVKGKHQETLNLQSTHKRGNHSRKYSSNPCPIDRCHHGLGDYTRQDQVSTSIQYIEGGETSWDHPRLT